MTLRPTLMNGTDLDNTVSSCAHLLGCDQRLGTIEATVYKWLKTLLDEGAAEQIKRRRIVGERGTVYSDRENATALMAVPDPPESAESA